MSLRPFDRPLVVTVVIVLVVIAGAIALWSRSGAPGAVAEHAGSNNPPESTAAGAQPPPPSQAAGTAQSAGLPAPTAEWMRVAPNPLVLEPPVTSTRKEERQISAGGSVVLLRAERHAFTLYVPANAVLLNQTVELTHVTQVKMPLSGQSISAVQITNLARGLQKPAILTIEPAPRGLHDPSPSPAVFVVDAASRELHLHPFLRSEETVGSLIRDRYQLLITGNGTYGVMNATPDELRTIEARVPTSYPARLDMWVARAMREAPARPLPSSSIHRWSIVPVVFAQSADDREYLSEVHAAALPKLREYYDYLVAAVKAFKGGCTTEKKTELAALNQQIVDWLKAAQTLALAEPAREQIDPEAENAKEMYPYSYQQQAARSEYFRKLREEFEDKQHKLGVALFQLIEGTIKTLNACCRSDPQAWMPGDILYYHRMAAIHGGQDELTAAALSEAQACVCSVAAVTQGKGWTGTITQNETYSGEARSATSRSRTVAVSTHRYSLTVSLLGADENGDPVGLAFASGEQKSTSDRVDTDWACATDEAGSSREVTGARGTEMAPVHLSFLSEGRYRINVPYPLATGLERHRYYSRRAGCRNRFNERTTNRFEIRSGTVVADFRETIHGTTKNAMELTGSQPLTQPDTHLRRNRQGTLTWNLKACASK